MFIVCYWFLPDFDKEPRRARLWIHKYTYAQNSLFHSLTYIATFCLIIKTIPSLASNKDYIYQIPIMFKTIIPHCSMRFLGVRFLSVRFFGLRFLSVRFLSMSLRFLSLRFMSLRFAVSEYEFAVFKCAVFGCAVFEFAVSDSQVPSIKYMELTYSGTRPSPEALVIGPTSPNPHICAWDLGIQPCDCPVCRFRIITAV